MRYQGRTSVFRVLFLYVVVLEIVRAIRTLCLKMFWEITLLLFWLCGCGAVELEVRAFDRRPKIFEIYNARNDAFQLTTLTHDDYIFNTTTDFTPSVTYDTFVVRNQLDYVDVMQVGGTAELNLAVGFLTGNIAASVDVRSDFRAEENTLLHVIKVSKRTRVERVACTADMATYVYEDLLESNSGPGEYVVVGVVNGFELEVHIKVTSRSKESGESLEASVAGEIGYMVNSLKASGKFDKSKRNQTSNEDFSVSVRTTHIMPPFAQPKTFEDVPLYLDKVTKYIAKTDLPGSVLAYIVEEKGLLGQYILGKSNVNSLSYSHSNLIVARVKQVSFEIDHRDKENVLAMKEFQKFRSCFSESEYGEALKSKSAADTIIAGLRISLSDAITDYRADNLSCIETLEQVEGVLERLTNVSSSMLGSLNPSLVSKVAFASTMATYNIMCLSKTKNPLLLPSSIASKEVRFLSFAEKELDDLLSSSLPNVFASSCVNQNLACYLLNCDHGFSVCKKLGTGGYYSFKNMSVYSHAHVAKTLELLTLD